MSALRISALVTTCGALVACAQLVGIGDFPGASDASHDGGGDVNDGTPFDAPTGLCVNGTPVLTASHEIDRVDVASGFLYGQGGIYIGRCDLTSACTDPPNLLQLGPTEFFGHAAIGASISYTLQDNTGGGSIHSMALDGTGDKTLFTSPGFPDFVTLSGTNTFWVDDLDSSSSTVHCIGCAGADAPWITNLDGPLALFSSPASVYVLAYDSTGVQLGIFGCDATGACASLPTTVIDSLDTAYESTVASDGTDVFVVRVGHGDIARVNSLGNVTTVVQGPDFSAIAVDGATHQIAFSTSTGDISIAPTDGSLTRRPLSTCEGTITWLAIDATNVYALIEDGTSWTVYAIKR